MKLDQIPILDCSEISGLLRDVQDKPAFESFTEKLGEAMSGIGFVYLVNHGVDSELVEDVYAKCRDFFQLPKDVKAKYQKKNPTEMFHGYFGTDDETLDENLKGVSDRKESWDCWGKEQMDESNFPSEVPGLKIALDACRMPMGELSKKLLRAFAVYLKLDDPDFLIKKHRAIDDQNIRSHNGLRSNYYPPIMEVVKGQTFPKDAMRLSEHMDWGTITILFQDSAGGLDAKNANGEWIPVPPIKDSIILNAGLMLEMWSGGHFPATPHRVRLIPALANKSRQSFGYFLQPDGDSHCVPVVQEKSTWNPTYPKVDKETHYEYFQNRIRATATKA